MKKNDIIKLKIESYAFEGKGIAKINQSELNHINDNSDKKYIIFVHNSYPGDVVNAEIKKLKKSYGEAVACEILTSGEGRTEAKCKHFGTCGGCKQQDLDYEYQTKYKFEQVKDIFERIGGFSDFKIEPTLKSEKIFYYRNKMDFSFTPQRWLTKDEINSDSNLDKNFALGFHVPKVFSKVINIEECYLQTKEATEVLNFTRNYFKERNTSIYSTKENNGYLRNLVLRESFAFDEFMVNLVTFEDNFEIMKEFSENLSKNFPFITTIVNNVNLRKAQVAFGDFEKVYLGNGQIFDKIDKYKFRISANSFFQTNTLQAENLYQTALDYADFHGSEIVYDLYSGASTISIFVSEKVKEVYGFESVKSAVKDGKTNCEINGIENVKSFEVDLNRSFLPFISEQNIPKPDVIIADPPRAGMNPKTVKDILDIEPKKIVYVSCNPSTQARDIKLLCEEKYKLIKIKPVDMFPQTYHIENVALLLKKSKTIS
ncbi:MAG: 23S rRNA (uracil(1939)-C(5))-methyltransferase RlmD [Ignavibacteriae bacterium]|nr:MAG: 23S rRNA (uracil(1939)-C(5))-methyltransferase RlmD [Ignavibacteriota bacterium]